MLEDIGIELPKKQLRCEAESSRRINIELTLDICRKVCLEEEIKLIDIYHVEGNETRKVMEANVSWIADHQFQTKSSMSHGRQALKFYGDLPRGFDETLFKQPELWETALREYGLHMTEVPHYCRGDKTSASSATQISLKVLPLMGYEPHAMDWSRFHRFSLPERVVVEPDGASHSAGKTHLIVVHTDNKTAAIMQACGACLHPLNKGCSYACPKEQQRKRQERPLEKKPRVSYDEVRTAQRAARAEKHREVCQEWREGTACKRGKRCPYDHPPDYAGMCKIYGKRGKCNFKECPFKPYGHALTPEEAELARPSVSAPHTSPVQE
jgi:hypothetical protein